ncbi:Xaa-Pro dipeptidase, partial [Pseudomonas sp. FW305-130]
AVHAGHLVDPVSGQVLADQMIIIRGGKVEAVGPTGKVTVPANARLIELGGETVLPGFIDVHVHLTANADDEGLNGLMVSTPDEAIRGVV